MACGATLKRSYEWDPLSPGRSPKRICMPGELMPVRRILAASSSPISKCTSGGPAFSHTAGYLTPSLTASTSSCALASDCSTSPNNLWRTPGSSPCSPRSSAPYSLGGSASDLKVSTSGLKISDNWVKVSDCRVKAVDNCIKVSSRKEEGPLLTQRQVSVICRMMVEEHEKRCRERFDRILQDKLSEQYESFLHFNHELVKRRFSASDASYVS